MKQLGQEIFPGKPYNSPHVKSIRSTSQLVAINGTFHHKKYFWKEKCMRHPYKMSQNSFTTKNIFYDKMDLRIFYFRVTIYGKKKSNY